MTVPSTGVALPAPYPPAGGIAVVYTGINGNIYYQFSDPSGAFVGFQNTGQPAAFRGNPFTINDPIVLNCGATPCSTYFGGQIARIDVRFTAYDGDTQAGGFDENDISLLINGTNVGNWSGRTTDSTNINGSVSYGLVTGFGNNTNNTGWFSSTDPALMSNILSTGLTSTQVLDNDPNDNYWNFSRGNSLPDEELRTVAPGYELEKTRRDAGDPFGVSGDDEYFTVGEVITYDYLVSNIGSVDINNIQVTDDRIGAVSCSPTMLPRTTSGGANSTSQCTGTYVVTQADVDAGQITNIAEATGDPEYGQLGTLSDSVTLDLGLLEAAIELEKTASPTSFTTVGQQITYTLQVSNTGNQTLSNVVVTDAMFPTLNCSFASITPLSSENTDNDEVCTAVYTVTQADIDNAAGGTQLVNNARVDASDSNGSPVSDLDSATVTGPTAQPALTVTKTATPQTFSAVGDVINYDIVVTNTGNVTWTDQVTINDPLTNDADESCPAGPVAPMASITCTSTYAIQQIDLDNEALLNTVEATASANGVSATNNASETIQADVMPALSIAKTLASGPDPFTSDTDQLVYEYVLSNDGNVVLNAIDLTDDKISLTCPATTLAAGATMTCTSDPYTITQVDLDAGSVTNIATATSETGQGGAVDDASATLTVAGQQSPALSLDKVAEEILAGQFFDTAEVDYTYTVTNSGNVTLAGPFSIDDDKVTTPITCAAGPLAPTQSLDCTGTYVVTSADVAATFVTNVASATDGSVTSPTDSATVPQAGAPGISIAKATTTADFSATTDSIDYTFTITNSGSTAIDRTSQNVQIIDPAFAASGDAITCPAAPATLLPMQSVMCSGTYTGISQADIDAGFFTNEATVSFDFGSTPIVSDPDSVTVSANVTPALVLTKTPLPVAFSAVGDVITYTMRVSNPTTQTIASANVSDPLIPSLSCTLTNIAPMGFQECSGTYAIQQADMDAGSVANTATASGTSSTGAAIPTDSDTATVNLASGARDPDFTLDKQASTASYAAVGDTIVYTFEVENTGNVTLSDIVVSDAPLGFTCNVPAIGPGDIDTSCQATKVITQDDIDNGSFVNTAEASAAGVPVQADSEPATGPPATPTFDFSKSASGSYGAVGDTVRYTFSVENTGNVTLTNLDISDTSAAIAPQTFSCTIPTLAPGATDASSCFFDYTVRQQDIDNGQISNTASIDVDTPTSGPLTDTASETTTGPAEILDLVVEKTEQTPDGVFAAGSTEVFVFEVTNNSNVTLTGGTLDDPLTGFSCALPVLVPNASTTTCADGSPLQTSYTTVQADVDRGTMTNEVTVEGSTTQGSTTSGSDQLTLVGPDQLPALTMDKTSPTADFDMVGDVVDYEYQVTNAGNITITSPITVDDDNVSVSCPALPTGGLAPLASITCTASATISQSDLDAGSITNIASADVSQPVVPNATYPGGLAAITSPTDTLTVGADQLPALSIDKRVKSTSASTYSTTSDVITFEFTVTNSGNVTTTAPITVDDADLGISGLACGAAGIAPGDSVTCEATWSPTQTDIDNGDFTNTATAQTVFDGSTITSASDSATVQAIQVPGLTITKTYDPSQTAAFSSTDSATYDYVVKNTGNETIFGPINVDDNLIGTILCDAGPLLPGASATCSGTYNFQSDDIKLGSVTNIATGSGTTLAGDPVTSPPISETVPPSADPAIEITKVASPLTFSQVGDQITYTYTVENTSMGDPMTGPPPALPNAIVINDDKIATPINCYNMDETGELLPGQKVTCEDTAVYTITQADLDAVDGVNLNGFVTNNAFGETTFGTIDPVVSMPVAVTVPGVATPGLSMVKSVSAGPDPAGLGDDLEYTIEVTNTGNQTLSGILVEDPMIAVLSCEIATTVVAQPLTMAPNDVAICVGTYTVTQADVDAQSLENTATVSGTNPQGTPVGTQNTISHPIDPQMPLVSIVKELAAGEPNSAFAAVGEVVTYTIAVENTGNVTLNNLVVNDILFPGQPCTIGTLAPAASDTTTCSFDYTVTQDDIDRGSLDNEASVTGEANTPDQAPVEDSDTLSGQGPDREPSITLEKSSTTTDFDTVGDVISYTFVIANTGNVTIEQMPVVSDPMIGSLMCDPLPSGGIAPTTSIECSGSYAVIQDDIDAGFVTNNASVSVANPVDPSMTLSDTSTATVTGTRTPALSVVKTASDTTDVQAGQTITYTYDVTNDGNVTLSNVALDDQHTTQAGTSALAITGNPIASIAVGETVQISGIYVVTQDDIDAGTDITNLVTATGQGPSGTPAPTPDTSSEVVEVEAADPSLVVLKTAAGPAAPVPNDTVTFTITVENDGNVSLGSISIVDQLRRTDGSVVTPAPMASYVSGDAGTIGTLDVDEVWTYEVVHTITQDDIDAGGLSNSAQAFGEDPFGTPTDDVSDTGSGNGATPTPFIIAPLPSIDGAKSITTTDVTLGALVQFEITATNTGNVTLNTVAVASDTLLRADNTPLTLTNAPSFFSATMGSGAGTLLVGETATYRASYVLTQDDIDAGGISNAAVVTGAPPVGGAVNDTTNVATLPIAAVPALDLAKGLSAGGPTYDAVDDLLTYTFTVTNTGNVTITDPIVINDPMITNVGGTITCAPVPLAPLSSLDCTGSYEVTQDDLNNGQVDNEATAQAGAIVSDPDTETVLAQQNPALETVKDAETITVDGTTYPDLESQYFVSGALVEYSYTVTNTGNVSVFDPITVSDNLIPSVICPAVPAAGLAPGDSLICLGGYTVTTADVELQSVTNLASATDGTTTSPLVSETIPNDGVPNLETLKEVTAVTNPDGSASGTLTFDEVGDVLTYTFTVENSGEVPFARDVFIVDDKIANSPLVCFESTTSDPELRPGETVTCEATYVVTQDDLNAGEVVNQAYAETSYGIDSTPVVSTPATETTPADAAPAIEISKAADTLPITAVGQVLTYTLTLENTGNQTLVDVRATDPLLPNMVCMIAELVPMASDTCSDTYVVTQDDIDNGSLVNTASASGVTPQGGLVEDDTSLTLAVPAAVPSFALSKSAMPDPFGAVGTSITYVFSVENTGNVTLFDVTVTDARLDAGFSCVVPRLNVGATDALCSYPYEITQDDKDAGEIENTALAEATDPFGTVVDATDTITTPSVPAEPGIEATKTVSGATALGSVITFTLSLENTGDVSLVVDTITDTMTRLGDGSATALDTPFGGLSGDADGDGLLDVTEVWTYTATHVLTQDDIDQGGLSNTVTVEATDPFGTPVDDISDNGNDADGDTSMDPTEFAIVPGPAIEAVKSVLNGGSVAGDTVLFEIDVTNVGDVSLTGVGVTDTLSRADGTVLETNAPAQLADPVVEPASMAPGATWTFIYSYTLVQEDVDAGGLSNSATATGTPPSGLAVTDVSDNGDDADGNLTGDPTTMQIAAAPDFDVVKTARPITAAVTYAGDVVVFDVTVSNNGNVTLLNLVVTDNLSNFDGDVLTPDAVNFTSGASETEIGAGQSNTYTVTYALTQADIDAGGVENSFVADVTTPSGIPLTDTSDDGNDSDGNTVDDPTQIVIGADPGLTANKSATIPVRLSGTVFEVTFDMSVTNIGNVTERDMQVNDDLAAFVAPATLVATTTPIVSGFATGGANPNYNGTSDISLVAAGTSLLPGETGTLQITVTYDTANGAPEQPNTLAVQGSSADSIASSTAGIAGAAPTADIFARKMVTPTRAQLGTTASYTLQFENRLATGEAGLTLIDDLPSGINVDASTIRYNGSATPAPEITADALTWRNVALGPNETITVTFDARVTGGAGEIVNRAYMLDSDGNVVTNVATATMTRRPEPVFDCGDVIGKVFDDRNLNGYQDGVEEVDRSAITDQTYQGSKFSEPPVITAPDYEPGLPNAKLFTVDGTMIETDEFGRFSVPCAALPSAIGSNFTLKLDERSLPTGYRVTTENPRVVRLTAGTIAKMNFGASIARVVDIDLMATAFQQGSATPTDALSAGVDQLITYLEEAPSVLRLTYYVNGEGRPLAGARLDEVEALVRARWRANGVYRLLIERSIEQVQ